MTRELISFFCRVAPRHQSLDVLCLVGTQPSLLPRIEAATFSLSRGFFFKRSTFLFKRLSNRFRVRQKYVFNAFTSTWEASFQSVVVIKVILIAEIGLISASGRSYDAPMNVPSGLQETLEAFQGTAGDLADLVDNGPSPNPRRHPQTGSHDGMSYSFIWELSGLERISPKNKKKKKKGGVEYAIGGGVGGGGGEMGEKHGGGGSGGGGGGR
jgi:hypothetical protein